MQTATGPPMMYDPCASVTTSTPAVIFRKDAGTLTVMKEG